MINAEDGSRLILGQEGEQLVFQHDGHGDPDPLAEGRSFYVRWVKFGNRKHIVCLGDDANSPGVDRVVVNTPYVKGAPHPVLPMKNGRRMWMTPPAAFISGIVSVQWLAPDRSCGHRTVHMDVTPPLEWPQRYPEDFPVPRRTVTYP